MKEDGAREIIFRAPFKQPGCYFIIRSRSNSAEEEDGEKKSGGKKYGSKKRKKYDIIKVMKGQKKQAAPVFQ